MNSMNKVILLILDGWGIGKKDQSDAIYQANTPFIDSLYTSVPNCTLKTFGENVGLPEGQMGNSEVGHMNIGAGRIVWQMLVRINKAFKEKSLNSNKSFQKLLNLAKENPNRKIHLMGLVSKGGVHSSQEHLIELCSLLGQEQLDKQTYIHAFTDGRDTDPHSGIEFLSEVEADKRLGKAQFASLCGRYYAMDRDQRWERTKIAYDGMVNKKGNSYKSVEQALEASYENGISDEFVKPALIETREGLISIAEDDIVLCFNFRTDRGRQITRVLTQENMREYNMHTLPLHYFTLTTYDKNFKNVEVLFEDEDLRNTLGELISVAGIKQLRAAETEKYPHVTFFFNGGREKPFVGEERLMVNSPQVATYDLQPEMSALELTADLEERIKFNKYGFICINFANPDMVGHTGVFDAIKKACETVDSCAQRLITTGKEYGYSFIVIADHGNADLAVNPDGSPNTAHSTNLVPCFIIDDKVKHCEDGVLADVAPSILKLMGLKQAGEMTGKALI